MTPHHFIETIKIVNGNPYASIPRTVLDKIFKKAKKDKGPVPVMGKLNGAPFKQTLIRYMGQWRLYINGAMLKNAGIKFKDGNIRAVVGTKVKIDLDFDPSSRTLTMHPKLKQALILDKIAKRAFDSLAPYRKHEILRYLSFLKTESSIDRNITRILQHLRGEESDALYPLMHRKK